MKQYRIEYRYIHNNYTSHGSWYESKEFIESWINHLNKEHSGKIHHWLGEK